MSKSYDTEIISVGTELLLGHVGSELLLHMVRIVAPVDHGAVLVADRVGKRALRCRNEQQAKRKRDEFAKLHTDSSLSSLCQKSDAATDSFNIHPAPGTESIALLHQL